MQKIAIFGGTGMTGQCAVRHALKKGLTVKLLYRSEATLPDDFKDGKVELIQGNVLNLEDVKKTIADVDGVAIILGTRNDLKPTTELSKGTENIILAMKEAGIKKLSACMSAFLFWEPEKLPPRFFDLNEDHKRMLELVKNSGLEWRAVLPPHIADEPTAEYEVAYDKGPGRSISKLDLGAFMVDCLDNEAHKGKVIGLATKK